MRTYPDGVQVAGWTSDPVVYLAACLMFGIHFPVPVRVARSNAIRYYRCQLCGHRITVKKYRERH